MSFREAFRSAGSLLDQKFLEQKRTCDRLEGCGGFRSSRAAMSQLHGFQEPACDGRLPCAQGREREHVGDEFLEKHVHGFEAVGIASIVAQQDVVFEKECVLAAVQEIRRFLQSS